MSDLHLARERWEQGEYVEIHPSLERIEQARRLFQRSYLKGKVAALKARLIGRSSQMLELTAVAGTGKVAARHAGGMQVVPIPQIQGSEGRTHDFDRYFNPLHPHIQERWMHLAMVLILEVPLPPVRLIQVGEIYYVQDGHHRISVAQALGYQYIDAEVTIWEVAKPATGASG